MASDAGATGVAPAHTRYDISVAALRTLFENRDDASELEKVRGAEGVAASLKVDVQRGISSSEEESRKAAFGENRIPGARAKTYLELLAEAFAVSWR